MTPLTSPFIACLASQIEIEGKVSLAVLRCFDLGTLNAKLFRFGVAMPPLPHILTGLKVLNFHGTPKSGTEEMVQSYWSYNSHQVRCIIYLKTFAIFSLRSSVFYGSSHRTWRCTLSGAQSQFNQPNAPGLALGGCQTPFNPALCFLSVFAGDVALVFAHVRLVRTRFRVMSD